MNEIQEARNIIDNFQVPEKLYNNVALTYEEVKDNKTYTLTNMADLDKDIKPTNNLDRNQQGYISDGISQLISKHHEKDIRYSLHPLQRSYDLVHKKTKEGKKFYEFIMELGWIHNLERMRKPNMVFADSMTIINDDNFDYNGNPVKAEINTDDVIDTLTKTELFKEGKNKIYHGSVWFDNNGESSVRSSWDRGEGCFDAYSLRPSDGGSCGFAVFGKSDQRVEVEKMKVAKWEYEALKRDSQKLKEIEPILNDLNSKFETIKKTVA